MKAAETDATKRALTTFGNPFGLALYDKDKLQVTRSRRRAPEKSSQRSASETAQTFIDAVLALVPTVPTLEALYAFWEANLDSLSLLRAQATTADSDPLHAIIEVLKARARVLGRTGAKEETNGPLQPHPWAWRHRRTGDCAAKSIFAFVGKQPCLVRGRRSAHAHHIRFAQPPAMGLKVSDEFTVPLCAGHHDALHTTGDERAWWARHGIIEPLKFAERLWAATRLGTDTGDGVRDKIASARAQDASSSATQTTNGRPPQST